MRLTSNLAPEDLQEGERRYSGLKERLARVTPNGKSIWKERHKKLIRMRRLLQILRSKRNFQTSSQKDPSERQG